MKKVKIGIIGCGNISGIYFKNLQRFENTEVVACADLMVDRAAARAHEFQVPKACGVSELLKDPGIELVVNLTIPKAHAGVALAALKAGKHVYGEKPLGINIPEGRKILAAARKAKRLVGSAPDTFLGGAFQTVRGILDSGLIGEPVAATAFMMCRGHERWHPDPEFYYKVGGGPMMDMGPYYLTALISLLGSIRRVSGSTRITFPKRKIMSQPKFGTMITVDTPTHLAGTVDFAGGAIGTLIMSFDTWSANLPRIEIHGTEASLSIPDPNGFGGAVKMFTPAKGEWQDMPLTHVYTDNWRGLGVADMAAAIRGKRPHRANGALAAHVLEVMQSFEVSSNAGKHIRIKSTCERPAAMPVGLKEGSID